MPFPPSTAYQESKAFADEHVSTADAAVVRHSRRALPSRVIRSRQFVYWTGVTGFDIISRCLASGSIIRAELC